MASPISTAPPVVAVVVSHDPGPWFEQCLASVANQSYSQLALLVIDTGDGDVTGRVEPIAPDAAVVRRPDVEGFGAAANLTPDLVGGAAYYLFLHDDVMLEDGLVERLVGEALSSNAAIVGPKLMDWDEDRRIRQFGGTIDRLAALVPFAEPGELDQQQHDQVRDTFVVPGGVQLVRSDVFAAVGGFDKTISFIGEDLDLTWRIRIAGGQAVVTPATSARHRERLGERRGRVDERRLVLRHRLYTMFKCYGWLHLLRVLPIALVVALAEVVYSLAFGRFGQARDTIAAWGWTLAKMPRILAERRRIKSYRRVRDDQVSRLQARGSARLNAFLRGQIGGETRLQTLAARTRDFSGTFRSGPRRTALVGWALVLAFLLFGTRHLLTRGVPVFGQFAEIPDGGALLHAYWGGWREPGLGSAGPGPVGLGLVGAAASVVFATGLLRLVLVLGLLPLGLLGMWRLCGPLGSRRGRMVAVVLYAANPLPYNALAAGRWDSLLLYGVTPFVVLRMNRLVGIAPYGPHHGEVGPRVPLRSLRHQVVSLAFLLAVVAAFEPLVLVLAPLFALVSVLFSGATGSIGLPLRGVALTVAASALAAVLHLPWFLEFRSLDDLLVQLLGRPSEVVPGELHRLLRFETGPWGGTVFGWAPLVVAAVPLLVARDHRAAWSARAWSFALGGFGAAWVAANGWIDDVVGTELHIGELLLLPAAVGLSWAAAAGFAAFEVDVPRFSFGWRQLTIGLGVVAFIASLGPVAVGSIDGRWRTPTTSLSSALSLIEARDGDPSHRVLWLGHAEVLPLDGLEVADGVLAATSVRGFPDLRHQWGGPRTAGQELLLDTIEIGLDGQTNRLGRLLAPFGIKYVVVVERGTPTFTRGIERPLSDAARARLASQFDLRPFAADPSVIVYENEAAAPMHGQFPGVVPPLSVIDDPAEFVVTDLTSAVGVLAQRVSATEYRGQLGNDPVIVAETFHENWTLVVDGVAHEPEQLFGWSMRFDAETVGPAELSFARTRATTLLLLGQVIAWALVVRVALAEGGRSGPMGRRAPQAMAAAPPPAEATEPETAQ